MTCAEKWNFIVEEYQRLYSSLESKIQTEWEMYCSDLFGYRKLFGEIDAQRHLSVGSGNAIIPDIILCVDKKDIFDIELKQYSLPFDQHFENQLISYLNQTHLSVGMIVCNKIYLYHYDYVPNTVNKIEIPFEKDHPDGIALMDILARETFSAEKIRDHICKKKRAEERILEIQGKITTDWVKELVKTKLTEDYPEIDVDSILNGFSFAITKATETISADPSKNDFLGNGPFGNNPPDNHYPDILPLLHQWCEQKDKEGKLKFLRSNSVKKYTRFTTQILDELIPYQENIVSGWRCGLFYTYQIENYDGKFKIIVTLSSKNAPESIRKIFSRIEKTGRHPQKTDWKWWNICSTPSFSYNEQTSPEAIFHALDTRFTQIQMDVIKLVLDMPKG